jgi:hypothetical protein
MNLISAGSISLDSTFNLLLSASTERKNTQKDGKKVAVSTVLAYFFRGMGGSSFKRASKKHSLNTTLLCKEPFVLICL